MFIILLLIYLTFAMGYPRALREWYLMIPIFLFFLFYFFIYPLVNQKGVHGYRNKLIAQDRISRRTPDPFDYIAKGLGRSTVIVLLLLLPLLFLPYFNGESFAENQEEYLVPSTHQNAVVLRIYGDNLICGELDRDGKKLNGNFFVLKVDDEPRPVLSVQTVGRLGIKH